MWLLIITIGGMFGGFIIASVLCMPILISDKPLFKIETLFGLFIVIFFLGDNFEGVFSFTQNLRFVILAISLFVLLKFELFQSNVAKFILPFSIVITLITIAVSPLGIQAASRGLSYFLVALVMFKSVQLLVAHDAKRFYDLIITVLLLYFSVTLLLLFVPFLGDVYINERFNGLMGNPNGLGFVAMFSYAVIDIIRRKNQTSFSPHFFTAFKIVLIGLVILTASRTALFSVLIYEITLRLLKYKFLLAVVLLAMIYIYGISATLSTEAIVESLGLSEYLRIDSLDDASGRTEVWAVALDEIQNQPWFGKGMLYDNYFINDFADRYIGEPRARHWYGIWNSYLSLLLNVGIIGLLGFAFFWYKMYALSQMRIVRVAFLMMCLFSAVSESWMAASMNAYMPMVFLCWALQIYNPKPREISL
ncbi:O-antigen ligase [Gelidibacter algens]|uniref:O-antigen ligase n=1 Tax=Gelidibacter algens TaxID=49280 RepID=A0A327S0T5_9FLAO|nr:O-antigen ligase [Gelidibacter algens]